MTTRRGPEPGTEQAKRGGQTVKAKYGPDFYSRIGKLGEVGSRTSGTLAHQRSLPWLVRWGLPHLP